MYWQACRPCRYGFNNTFPLRASTSNVSEISPHNCFFFSLENCRPPKKYISCSESSVSKYGAACAPTCQMLATGIECVSSVLFYYSYTKCMQAIVALHFICEMWLFFAHHAIEAEIGMHPETFCSMSIMGKLQTYYCEYYSPSI